MRKLDKCLDVKGILSEAKDQLRGMKLDRTYLDNRILTREKRIHKLEEQMDELHEDAKNIRKKRGINWEVYLSWKQAPEGREPIDDGALRVAVYEGSDISTSSAPSAEGVFNRNDAGRPPLVHNSSGWSTPKGSDTDTDFETVKNPNWGLKRSYAKVDLTQ